MNDQNRVEAPKALTDPELDAMLAEADRELRAEIRQTTDTAAFRDEILKAHPKPAEPGSESASAILDEEPPRQGIRAAIGNFLIALTGANRRFLTFAIDRQRHVTMGMLMLLTTGLAFYAGTSVAAMGFSRPFSHEIGYGTFFALFVFFIDRSIVGYVTPARLEDKGNGAETRTVSRWTPWPRILIAIAASFLLSEVIVLQLFTARINEQLRVDQIRNQATFSAQVESDYQGRISALQAQINAASSSVSRAQAQVSSDTKKWDCQLYGCPGTPAGYGPAAAETHAQLLRDQQVLAQAQQSEQSVRATYTPQIARLEEQANAQISSLNNSATASGDMLAREQALGQITQNDGTVLILRIILWLVLVGIDLTPVIIKITTSSGVYEERIRSQILIAKQNTRELVRRQEARIRMETDIDFERQRLDLEIAQAELAKRSEDLASIRGRGPKDHHA